MASEIGQKVVAISSQELSVFAQKLARSDRARSCLKVSSGEHIAAIILSAFLHVEPKSFDGDGEVDLQFDLAQDYESWFPASGEVAFEVKSLPGPFREINSHLHRHQERNEEFTPDFSLYVQNGAGVLAGAIETLRRATKSLVAKSDAATSKNVFLVVHPFDNFAADVFTADVVAGHLLPPIEGFDELDTVWVFWSPYQVTMWNNKTKEWLDMLFAQSEQYTGPDDPLTVLQSVEIEYLSDANVSDSPYVFGLSFLPDE